MFCQAGPSKAEQEEVEDKYKDTLSNVRKMTKATHDLAYDASCCAAKSKAVLKEKPYLQDMIGTLKDHMIFNEAKDQIISYMTILADEEPKPYGLLLAQQLLEQGNHHLEAFKCGVFSDVKANVK